MNDPLGTLPDSVRHYLEELVAVLSEILTENLIGIYATGSIALNGFVEGRSDIDVVTVTTEDLSTDLKLDVTNRVRHPRFPCPAAGLELVVYPRAVTEQPSVEAGFVLEVNTGIDLAPLCNVEPAGRPGFWYVIDRAITRQSGIALFGPPPADLFAEFPAATLVQMVIDSLRYVLTREDADLVDNAVLNACRAIHFAASGSWVSKPCAARWAIDEHRLSDEEAVRFALGSHSRERRASKALSKDRIDRLLAEAIAILIDSRHTESA
jgi:Aminoglycoside adenylyltransferase, C-terminal domain